MLKATILASAVALCLAQPARATNGVERNVQVTEASNPAFHADVVEVQSRRSTGSIILGDAVGGLVIGAAVGGGVALYNRYVSSDKDWGNWQRDLAIGAGIGLAAGLIFGVVDASSNSDSATTRAVADQRQSGFAPNWAEYGKRF